MQDQFKNEPQEVKNSSCVSIQANTPFNDSGVIEKVSQNLSNSQRSFTSFCRQLTPLQTSFQYNNVHERRSVTPFENMDGSGSFRPPSFSGGMLNEFQVDQFGNRLSNSSNFNISQHTDLRNSDPMVQKQKQFPPVPAPAPAPTTVTPNPPITIFKAPIPVKNQVTAITSNPNDIYSLDQNNANKPYKNNIIQSMLKDTSPDLSEILVSGHYNFPQSDQQNIIYQTPEKSSQQQLSQEGFGVDQKCVDDHYVPRRKGSAFDDVDSVKSMEENEQFEENKENFKSQKDAGVTEDDNSGINQKDSGGNDTDKETEILPKNNYDSQPPSRQTSFMQRESKNQLEIQVTAEGCHCKRSKCLQMYCQCFAANNRCTQQCQCHDCHNIPQFQRDIDNAVQIVLLKNPSAFTSQIEVIGNMLAESESGGGGTSSHTSLFQNDNPSGSSSNNNGVGGAMLGLKGGCNCKKTGCIKKYCECFNSGVQCSYFCQCEGCMNCAENAGGGAMDVEEEEFTTKKLRKLSDNQIQGNAYHLLQTQPRQYSQRIASRKEQIVEENPLVSSPSTNQFIDFSPLQNNVLTSGSTNSHIPFPFYPFAQTYSPFNGILFQND